jgi:hypothetical protein
MASLKNDAHMRAFPAAVQIACEMLGAARKRHQREILQAGRFR